MIHEEICTYEVAKLAKEKGFDVPTAEFYNEDGNVGCYPRAFPHNEFADGDYAAPTQSLLQRWLREEKGVDIAVVPNISKVYSYIVYDIRCIENRIKDTNTGYSSYELALEDALKYALENLL